MFILEGTGEGRAESPSCPWLCCTPSYSCTILQRAAEVTEDTFAPFNMFWLLLSWILSFWILESDDFRLYLDEMFMECLGKTLLSSIQLPLGVPPHARGCCLPLSSLPLPVPAVLLPGSAAGTRTGACGTHHSSHRVKWLACLLVRKGQDRNGSISQQFMQQNHTW